MSGQVLFIGGGNMAASLIGGLLADGHSASSLAVVEPDPKRREWLLSHFGIQSYGHDGVDDQDRIIAADVCVVLAVKPQVMQRACIELADRIDHAAAPLVLSIAAGIRSDTLQRWLDMTRVVRAMPNTPALVRAGATGLYAPSSLSSDDRGAAESIMRSVGMTCWVDEESGLDTITALSGSGPAYAFYLMEAMQRAASELGLAPDVAERMSVQTLFGAAKLALESSEPAAELRRKVTSPNGTTEAAIAAMSSGGFEGLIRDAITAATKRSRELGDESDAVPVAD